MLIVFSGLPGVGKTAISREMARRTGAFWLRIDSLETALVRSGIVPPDMGPAGYLAAAAIAEDNLRLGRMVVVDCVNPLHITRRMWHEAAARAGAPCRNVEVICSDESEHRRRVEGRVADISGHQLPDWAAVRRRHYEPWENDRTVIDTATFSVNEAVAACIASVRKK